MSFELRWLIQENAVTAADVEAAYGADGPYPSMGRMEVKKALQNRTAPRLQYRSIQDGFSAGYWVDVPTVVEPHKTAKPAPYADIMSIDEFNTYVAVGAIVSSDGTGYWMRGDEESQVSCFSTRPEWATGVAWYNK